MTKEITKASILQQIQDKLKLREFEPANFLFDETVIPVYDISNHLGKAIVGYGEEAITTIGGVTFYTVPDNERWFLTGYNVIFMGAGAYTVAGAYITRLTYPLNFMYLDLTAAQTVSYAVNLPKALMLQPGDTLNINIDGYTSPQDLRLYIDVWKEEIR